MCRLPLYSAVALTVPLVLPQCVSSYDVLSRGGGSGAGNALAGAPGAAGQGSVVASCQKDEDCRQEEWCTDGSCSACAPSVNCASGLALVRRHGCEWCVPFWDCNTELECDPGAVCYAGQTCAPACNGDSTCCYGNICSNPGCGTTEGLDCAVVGCAPSFYCDIVVANPICSCVKGKWACSPGSGNTCKPG